MARHGQVSAFYRVKCKDCGNAQVVFSKAATKVACSVCNTTLAEPAGGYATLHGEIVDQLS